jgi:transcriptional regulator with XRE-family HTH domain
VSVTEFGRRLKEARNARGLTQATLAERIGSTQPQIVEMEAGTRVVNLVTAVKLADALYVSLDWLAGRVNVGGPADPQPRRA